METNRYTDWCLATNWCVSVLATGVQVVLLSTVRLELIGVRVNLLSTERLLLSTIRLILVSLPIRPLNVSPDLELSEVDEHLF